MVARNGPNYIFPPRHSEQRRRRRAKNDDGHVEIFRFCRSVRDRSCEILTRFADGHVKTLDRFAVGPCKNFAGHLKSLGLVSADHATQPSLLSRSLTIQ